MKKYYNMFLLNIKYENLRLIIYFIFFSFLLSFYGITFFQRNSEYIAYSTGDLFLFLVGGVKAEKNFLNYVNWFGIILIVYLPMVYMLSKQFQDRKIFIFYRVKDYKNWYYYNIIWTFFNVFVFLLILYIIILGLSLFGKNVSYFVKPNEFNYLLNEVSLESLILKCFLLNFLFFNSLILLASNLTFLTRNFNASVLTVLILSYLTSLSNNKYLIGNVAMIMKENIFVNGNKGLNFKFAVVYLSLFLIINLVVGHLLYRRNIEF